MNSYKDITNKYLKHNKKRTVLTIAGVILSIALITSIGLFLKSMESAMISDAIKESGSFHAIVTKNDNKTYEKLKNNPKIEKVGVQEVLDIVPVEASKAIEICKVDKVAEELLPYKVAEGALPKNEGEIAVEQWVLNYVKGSPKIGEKIKLNLNNGEAKEYKITGILKNEIGTQQNEKATAVAFSEKFNYEKSNILIKISKKADISDTINEVKNSLKTEKVTNNEKVLRVLGESSNTKVNNAMFSMIAIIIGIVVIATVAVIYNAFHISVIERIKQFGLLRAVGATPAQIRKIVLREATIITIIGIPLGLLSGVLALYIVFAIFKAMSNTLFADMALTVSLDVFLISAAVGIFSIYASAMFPARFAGKISPLVAISSRTSIVKEKIKKGRGKLLKNLLSIEGLMAYKNIKRNRKRFRVTVFSIVISITLFIFFASFVNMTDNFKEAATEDIKIHFVLNGVTNKKGESSIKEEVIKKVKENSEVVEIFKNYNNLSTKALIDKDKKSKIAEETDKDIYKAAKLDGKDTNAINVSLDFYDENKLKSSKKYLKAGEIDKNKMLSEKSVIIVGKNFMQNKKSYVNAEVTNLKVGDSFYIEKKLILPQAEDSKGKEEKNSKKDLSFKESDLIKLKVAGIVNEPPYEFFSDSKNLRIIAPKELLKEINKEAENNLSIKSIGFKIKDEAKEKEVSKWLQPIADSNGINVVNNISSGKENETSILQLKILLFGFVAVVSLIGVVNIINTITTNLMLRKKEIASLNALGMTYKDVRKMIITEGILYGIYGGVIGTVLGVSLNYMMFKSMSKVIEFSYNLPWKLIIIAFSAALIIGLLAVIRPLNRIKNENIIEVIRSEE